MADKGLKYVGTNPIIGVALGSQVGRRLYVGDALVWEKGLSIISYNLTNVTTNGASSVQTGGSFSATLVAATDYFLLQGFVTVKMGGTDITSTAYDHTTKTITIARVTGDFVITAEAVP